MAEPGVWLYAGEIVGRERLRDIVIIAAGAPSDPAAGGPRLAYVAEARPGVDLTVGAHRLRSEPARLALVAADETIRSVASDLALLERKVRGAARGGEAAVLLAGVILTFAGTGALVRSSRWPLLGWTVALLVARGAIFGYRVALEPQTQALAARVLGAWAAIAPTVGFLLLGLVLVAADVVGRGRQAPRRRARLA